MRVGIDHIECHLPLDVEDGKTLKADNPDWRIEDIEQKTGISRRYICRKNETAVDLGVLAAEKLFRAGVDRSTISGLVFVTQSPDYVLPTSACVVQDRLKLPKSCMAFDVNLGCSGYIYGLAVGSSLIETGVVGNVMLICADTYSKYIAKSDRTCRPIFSDGAAATLLSGRTADRIGPFELGTDGTGSQNLIVPNSGARKIGTTLPEMHMDGAKVFMFTMAKVPDCVKALLTKAEKTLADIDLFVFHQASKLVIENIVRRLEIPEEKVYTNFQRIGNTVSASVPMALKDAVADKRLRKGGLAMLVGFGVGYSWGACLVKWGDVN